MKMIKCKFSVLWNIHWREGCGMRSLDGDLEAQRNLVVSWNVPRPNVKKEKLPKMGVKTFEM